MSELRFEALSHGELAELSATFTTGSHVVLGGERDGTNTLLLLASGLLRPTSGRVTLDGKALWSNASLRRRCATLYAHEVLLPARDTAGAIALALSARGDTRSALSVLEAAGLASLAPRRSSDLSTREVRAAALALALSHPAPTLLALYEPLALVGLMSEDFILQSLRKFADSGAIVVCSASRAEDAARLGGALSVLQRGLWLDPSRLRPAQAHVTLRVQTSEPRRLAARLSEAPDVSAVEWSGGQELVVHGAELERVAQSVVANARAEAIRITALKQEPKGFDTPSALRTGSAPGLSNPAHNTPPARPL